MSDKIPRLGEAELGLLFRDARTHNGWLDRSVSEDQFHELYELMKWGPTSANTSPARLVFLQSQAAKQRLLPALLPDNVAKTLSAPVTVIVAYDLAFYERLPMLFPHTDARAWFVGNQALIETTAFRNGTLQGAYLILAARALGLDTGALSGFDNAMVDREFLQGTPYKSNFLLNLGYGDHSKIFARSPRLAFTDAAQIL